MPDRWLSLKDAAERVGRSERTLKVWRQHGEITVIAGHVRESQVLEVERAMRERVHTGWKRRRAAGSSASSAR